MHQEAYQDGCSYGYLTALIFLKVTQGEIHELEYCDVAGMSLCGPLLTIVVVGYGIIYLLAIIPYKILFPKKKDKEEDDE